jgi:hypothetical protein
MHQLINLFKKSDMKKYYKIFSLAMLVAATAFSSCTKEDSVFDSDDQGGIIELADLPSRTSATLYSLTTKSLDAVAEISVPITVNYTGVGGAPSDITVTLRINSAALTAYNTSASTSYLDLPTTLYTVSSPTITIPKGSKTGSYILKIKTSSFDFTKSYALGITISSATAGTVSGNYGTGIFRIVAKNAYEASYTVTGWLFHPTAGRAINATKTLATAGAVTSTAAVGDLGGSNYYFNFDVSGSTLTNYAAAGVTPTGLNSGFFTSDQPGASATWGNSSGSADRPGTSPWLHSTYNNTYDAATKTFYMHYGYVASGGSGQASWTRQVYEKWVRK